MIYCPYVLIKLFLQSDSEKERERERSGRRGKEVKSSAYKLDVRLKRAGNGNGSREKYVEKYIYKEQRAQETVLKQKRKCLSVRETERGCC